MDRIICLHFNCPKSSIESKILIQLNIITCNNIISETGDYYLLGLER